jgi:hypothetical protein
MLWAGQGRVAPLDPTAVRAVFAGLALAAEDPDGYENG